MSDDTKALTARVEALNDLVQSVGWAMFTDHAKKTWDEEFHKRVLEAVGIKVHASMEQMQVAQGRLQQAAAIQQELRTLFQWPQHQLTTWRAQIAREAEAETTMSRRGSL